MNPIKVSKISIFPFKSLKGFDVEEWPIDEHGLRYDRMYMLAYETPGGDWKAITQREVAPMARIRTELFGDEILKLSYETANNELREATLPLDLKQLPQGSPKRTMQLWGYDMVVSDIGAIDRDIRDFFQDFFRDFVKKDKYTTVTVVASHVRREVPKIREHTRKFMQEVDRKVTSSFQDIWPGTVMTTASYEDLRAHVKVMADGSLISTRSFRMNLTVDTDEPWVEDDWLKISIGGHEWLVDSPAQRCPIPSIDQDLGEFRKGKYPSPALWKYRVLKNGETPSFGVNIANKSYGYTIKVGDEVEVLEAAQ